MLKSEINDYLDNILKDFFPKSGGWKSNCFRRESTVSEANLPCHLRDVDWLASLIMKKYNLFSLGESEVKEYISDSPYFNRLRSEYEQRIVKWQINWIIQGGDNWIIDNKLGGELFMISPKCDYAFRKGVVDTLLAIGMDISAIEEGIEKNADMWRDLYMNLAFSNEFDPLSSKINFRLSLNGIKEEIDSEQLKEPDHEFKEKWLKYRKYQYYQKHKKSIDMYSAPTTEMIMSPEKVKKLKLYLAEKSLERHKEIEEYNNRKRLNSEVKHMSQQDLCHSSYNDSPPNKSLLKRLVTRLGVRK